MHSPDKLQQFFDLRSRGNCLSYISRTIGVPTSTLSDWNRRYALDIDASRACKWEAAEQAVKFNTEADLVRVIQRIDAFERELDRRSPERMSVGELVRVISLWRREYFRRRNGLLRSIERPAPIPESEISGKFPERSPGPRPPLVAQPVTPDLRAEPRCKTESNSRGLTSHDTSENTATTFSANAARDTDPAANDNAKPEKTGIPESHSPTFSPAHPHAVDEATNTTNPTDRSHAVPSPGAASRYVGIGENDDPELGKGEGDFPALNPQPSTLNSSPPPLFSIEDHLPTPMDEWLPDDDDQLLVYRSREATAPDHPISKKTNIASAA
jgi:hypothetical protein